jgi:hypothetical protein
MRILNRVEYDCDENVTWDVHCECTEHQARPLRFLIQESSLPIDVFEILNGIPMETEFPAPVVVKGLRIASCGPFPCIPAHGVSADSLTTQSALNS